ncbi:MAG: hypothetical protein AB2A00_28050 [Myxococcota bacterium]
MNAGATFLTRLLALLDAAKIVAKLEWSKLSGGSQRQRRDVVGILTVQTALDIPYIEHWVRDPGLDEEWAAVRALKDG